ncbi:hypothetical protein SAMN05192529_10737 [Arachidicoccus rhizosphaerae]|uniref:Uncharacterized protein n=1 Tax=Arachidicoccus rhizosphaerae TaxID=551991 RepID=A0A1H3Y320_9BACT|nr:hypothetical protein [Arachidicoccus rhizosphaerae]SEA05232.1 hypothetical protein SAMN05192529_10737 [Arachidicoccus rhizosphaerae]
MASTGKISKRSAPITTGRYTSTYQRAKAKAYRLHWQDAASHAEIPVKNILKKLTAAQKRLPDTAFATLHNKEYLQKKPADNQVGAKNSDKTAPLPFKLISKRNLSHRGGKNKPPFSLVLAYQFELPRARGTIILRAFYYPRIHTFMLKFYNKNFKSLNKYAVRTHKGGFPEILRTCFAILKELTGQFPEASFGFMGERSFFKDKARQNTLLEPMEGNQRFRIYRLFLQAPQRAEWLHQYFIPFEVPALSTCLLLSHRGRSDQKTWLSLQQMLRFMATAYPQLNYAAL